MRYALFMALAIFIAAPAAAEPEQPAPHVLHTPVNQSRADKPFDIEVRVEHEGLLTDLSAIVRAADGSTHVLPFERSGPQAFRVTVPATLTAGRTLGYAIVSIDRAGVERKHFASLKSPHPVDLYGEGKTAKLRRQLARYDGKRQQVRLTSEIVAFGSNRQVDDNGLIRETDAYSDNWQLHTGEWTYRTLSWVHDFRIKIGYMRAGAVEADGERLIGGDAPGLNYGAAEANFELHRWFTLGGRFILGANEEGFVTGLGVIARIGDLTKTHVAIDYEGIGDVGARTDIRLHWTTLPRFPMALGVTFTDWPDDRGETANMLTYDLGFRVGEAALLGLRFGAANRPESLSSGLSGGVNFAYGF